MVLVHAVCLVRSLQLDFIHQVNDICTARIVDEAIAILARLLGSSRADEVCTLDRLAFGGDMA